MVKSIAPNEDTRAAESGSSELRGEARTLAILDAALELIGEVGYERVTMDSIEVTGTTTATALTLPPTTPGKHVTQRRERLVELSLPEVHSRIMISRNAHVNVAVRAGPSPLGNWAGRNLQMLRRRGGLDTAPGGSAGGPLRRGAGGDRVGSIARCQESFERS